MASPDSLDDKIRAFLAATVLYSDIPKDALPTVMRRVEVAVKIHLQQDLRVNEQSIYDLTSKIVMGAERKAAGGSRDALNSAVSLQRPLNGNTETTFLDLQAMVDQEAQEEQFSDFSQALGYLSGQLPAREYSYLLQLLVQRPNVGGFNLLTEDYAKENLPKIRKKLQLVMRLFPEVDPTARVYQLDLERALEKYVGGVYEEVLMGVREEFPKKFFATEEKRVKGRILTRMLVERVVGIDPREKRMEEKHFRSNKLFGMLQSVYGGSSATALEDTYQQQYKRWEVSRKVGLDYWIRGGTNRERAREATRWLVEDKLKWTPESGRKIGNKDFKENGLSGMLRDIYGNCVTAAVIDAYPGRHHPWQIGWVPREYWSGEQGREHARVATRWLIEEKLKLKLEDAATISSVPFRRNRLGPMLSYLLWQLINLLPPLYPRLCTSFNHGHGKIGIDSNFAIFMRKVFKVCPY